jgi:hypothetical protein
MPIRHYILKFVDFKIFKTLYLSTSENRSSPNATRHKLLIYFRHNCLVGKAYKSFESLGGVHFKNQGDWKMLAE